MTFSLAPFAFDLLQALGIHARIMGRDGLIERPDFASKAVLARLRTGIRALEAFLRRLLILMALEIEPDLIDVARPENMARAKASMPAIRQHALVIFPATAYAGADDFELKFASAIPANADASTLDRDAAIWPHAKVHIGRWLDRLDHLYDLTKDPLAKARRLAFTLARSRHGILMAPYERPRILYRWGTEASALHDAMAFQILQKSRSRPPPLRPPRRGLKPTITRL